MNGSKTGIRFLSLVLALCLIVGILPAGVFAAETTVSGEFSGEGETHYLMFATDRHANTTIIGSIIDAIESNIGENTLEYLGLGGDMVGSGNDHPAYNSATVLGEITGATSSLSADNVDLVAGIHDMNCTDDGGILLPYTSGGACIYEGEEYYIYGVSESCISGGVDDIDPAAEAAAFVTWANGAEIDQSKVIIVLSHYPLHKRRNDNLGATYWVDAMNTVALGSGVSDGTIKRNIIFFWGHNHTGESTADTNVYHLAPGSSMSVQGTSSSASETKTIQFTYANAGYLNANKSATLVAITDTSITFDKYTNSGSSHSTTGTVNRVQSVVPVTLEVTGESEYALGEAFVEPVVSVKYSDGSSRTVTGYTVGGTVDTGAEGTYELTYSYSDGGYAASAVFSVSVVSDTATVTYEDALTIITATSAGLTDISVDDAYDEENPLAVFGSGYYVAYDIALEGYTAGNSVTYTMLVESGVDPSGIALYYVNADGSVEPLAYTSSSETEDGYEYITLTFTTDKVGTFAYGTPEVSDEIPEGAVLSGLTVTGPTQTIYFLETSLVDGNVYLNITGLKVIAQYTLDGEAYYRTLEWNQFDESIDGYELTCDDLTTYGEKTVIVSYGGQSHQFRVWVCTRGETDAATTVSVDFDTPCVVSVTVEETDVAVDLAAYLTNYVAYDITAGYAGGYTALQGTATVTLPIPEGVARPVVYYVSEDGATVEQVAITASTDTTVTFTTDHFSTYVVGESTEIEVPEPGIAENVTGTTTAYEEKEVYVLVNSIAGAGDYLIASGNSGTVNLLTASNSGVTNTSGVSVRTSQDADGDTITYIEDPASAAIWTASANGSGYRLYNSYRGRYLRYNNNLTSTNRQNDATTWLSDDNVLYYSLRQQGSGRPGSSATTYTYSVYYNNGWTVNSSTSGATKDVYIYQKQTVKFTAETTTTGDYSIAGNPGTLTEAVCPGDTVDLGSILTFDPESGSTTTTQNPEGVKYEIYDADGNVDNGYTGDPNGIITGISGNTVTFSGKTGKALVKITYTGKVGNTSYTVTNYIQITAILRNYRVNIRVAEGDETTDPGSVMTAKQGATLDLSGTTITYEDGRGTQTESGTITWETSDESLATVDENGNVTVLPNAEGEVTITASYVDPYGNTIVDTLELNIVDAVWSLNMEAPVLDGNGDKVYATDEDGNTLLDINGNPYYATTDITAPIVVKDVIPNQTNENVWAVITKDGVNIGSLSDEEGAEYPLSNLTFISSNESIATVDKTTGIVTFTGMSGTVTITAVYEYAEGKSVTDSVIFSVSDDHYFVPDDGTDDFPEYPNEGAIRFDKTATAVGNFSETGITQIELSMTGVPYTKGNEMDVVLMLDQSTSMDDDRIAATAAATKLFIKNIVINEDGSFNNNRIYVGYFNGTGSNAVTDLTTNEEDGFQIVSDQDEYDALLKTIDDKFNGSPSSTGTDYANSMAKCYDILYDARQEEGYTSKQFCVFMSDGVPTYYQYSASGQYTSSSNIQGMFTGTDYDTRDTDYYYEYYSGQLKAEGVSVFTVGLGLEAKNNAWSSASAAQCLNAASILLNDMSGPAYESVKDTGTALSKKDSYFFSVEDSDAASQMSNVFGSIAQSILEAAKDVKVEDKMGGAFTMVFEAPNPTVDAADGGQEYYIEVKEYNLKAVTDTNGNVTDYTRDTSTSRMKLYLGRNGDTHYAASDNKGTAHASPVFEETALGSKYYWTTDSEKATAWPTGEKDADGNDIESGISVTVSGTTYYFTSDGDGTHNLTSGAYAYGSITTEIITKTEGNETKTEENATSNDLIIATPYFVYNAATKVLVWTAEELGNTELALSYFLYLDKSAGWYGSGQEVGAGTYETNEYADLTYSNFNENECEQELPVPQITYNGAQVSYVFYLVNEDGQPVNRAGRVVPFSEAVYVTDVFTYAITWNDMEQVASLEASYIAGEYVPSVYRLYDEGATYNIHVFADEEGQNLNNHFVIGGSKGTTYVFNTKADAIKYTKEGAYAAETTYLCKDYDVAVDDNGDYTYIGSNIQYEMNGSFVYDTDVKGLYTIVRKSDATEVRTGFDFSNTTVAFAVVWTPALVEDVVVIDYGLDVVIDVTTNDTLSSSLVGVRADAPDAVINTGTYTAARVLAADIEIDGLKVGTASIESLTSVRFSLDKSNGMQLTEPVTFYYESDVNYFEGSDLQTASMYSSVTVIPAATVYYEDSFVTFSDGWATVGTTLNSTQAQDRPGASQISAALDADNLYGYDGAYTNMSEYSMGSARMVTLDSGNVSAEASFTFYGTGFDVIGLTSNKTGTLIVDVFPGGDASGSTVKSLLVDTYFGYTRNEDGTWVEVSSGDPNALYQVPVMAVSGLTYGKYYVRITALYDAFFDHVGGSYDLYLDAIRVYDPTGVVAGNTSNDTDGIVSDAYADDGEAWPVYEELRNNVISAADFTSGEINGITFIDGVPATVSVADYTNFGPNNELYLAPGQAIVFSLDLDDYVDANGESTVEAVHLGIKSADGNAVSYVIREGDSLAADGSTAADLTGAAKTTVSTSTDMYYDITPLKDNVIVIYNAGTSGILSLTNIKITFKQAHRDVSDLFYVDYELIMAIIENLQKVTSGEIDGGTDEGSGSEGNPNVFNPAVTVYYPVDVYTGKDFTVTVVTSADVTSIRIGESVINAFAEIADTGERQWTHTLKATTNTNTQDIIVTAYGADNAESAPVTVTANVILDAEMTVSMPVFVNTNETFAIDVTTNTDVTKLKVNDAEYTVFTEMDGKRLWSISYTASETAGTEVIQVIAYNQYLVASEPIMAEVEVADFAPTVTVVPAAISVNSGGVIKVTVTTSSNVVSISVNNQLITSYRTNSNGERVWTAEVVAAKDDILEGKLLIKVVAYDDDGRPYAAPTAQVKVTETSSPGYETIKGIISIIVSKLRGWLGW